MNSFAIVIFSVTCAAANAGILSDAHSTVLQGPSTRTAVIGPDGSTISAVAPGGQIITEQDPGYIAHSAPVIAAAPIAYSAPSATGHTAYAAPIHTYAAPLIYAYTAYAAPTLAYAGHGIVGHHGVDTIVAGPSGTVAASRGLIGSRLYGHGLHGHGHGYTQGLQGYGNGLHPLYL